jgi:hypothetical protein
VRLNAEFPDSSVDDFSVLSSGIEDRDQVAAVNAVCFAGRGGGGSGGTHRGHLARVLKTNQFFFILGLDLFKHSLTK